MFFNEDHLKVTKVRTLNGNSPLIKDGRVQTKVVFFPNNPLVRKLLEEQNTRLLDGMKMKIELVRAYNPSQVSMVVDMDETNDLKKQLEELKQQNAQLKIQNEELQSLTVIKVTEQVPGSEASKAVSPEKENDKKLQNEKK